MILIDLIDVSVTCDDNPDLPGQQLPVLSHQPDILPPSFLFQAVQPLVDIQQDGSITGKVVVVFANEKLAVGSSQGVLIVLLLPRGLSQGPDLSKTFTKVILTKT